MSRTHKNNPRNPYHKEIKYWRKTTARKVRHQSNLRIRFFDSDKEELPKNQRTCGWLSW